MSNILGIGELSRLYQRLFNQTSLVTDISSGLYVPKDPGILYIQADIASISQMNLTIKEILNELKNVIHEGVSNQELERARVNIESERLYATQTADGMAGRLAFLQFLMGDLNFDQIYTDELRTVTSDQIKIIANQYLDYHRMSGVLLLPHTETQWDMTELNENVIHFLDLQNLKTTHSPVNQGLSHPRTLAKQRVQPPIADRKLIELPTGMKVCINVRPRSHVFSIQASVLGGVRLEVAHPLESLETDWGTSYLMAFSWTKGTSTQDVREIAAITEGHAANLEGFSGRHTVGLQMTGLAKDWTTLSPLFTNVLLDPLFPKHEVDHARRIAEDSIRTVKDHSSQLCSQLFLETLFENHPYGRMPHGSLESIQKIHSEKLRTFQQSWVRPERLVLSISGSVSETLVMAWAQQIEHRLQIMHEQTDPVHWPQTLDSEPELKAPRWAEQALGREQCHILVGGLGIQMTNPARHTCRLLQTILGGQSGRLFLELREKKSLAYTVSPIHFEGIERGYQGIYIACAPQKKEEAILGIQKVLEKLAAKGPTASEMKRAQEFFLGRRAMDLQSDTALAAHYGFEILYQTPHETHEQLTQKIRAITAKEVQNICHQYWVKPHHVITSVG